MNRRAFLAATGSALVVAAAAAARAPTSDDLHAEEYRRKRKFVSTPFGRIAYLESGAGPGALFLHGFPLNSFQWRHAIERLDMHRRCLAPDFLAMGHTQVRPGQDVGPASQVSMIVAFLDAVRVDQVDVVANDSGGAVAQLLVAGHAKRVRSLLLTNCDSAIQSPPPALLPVIDLAKQGRFVDEWLGRWRSNHDLARSPEGIGGMCYSDPANPTDAAIEAYFAPLLTSQRRKDLVHAYAIALEANPLVGTGEALRNSSMPVRILWGTADTIFSTANADYLDGSFVNSRRVRKIDGRKLFWPEEDSNLLAEEARALWGVS